MEPDLRQTTEALRRAAVDRVGYLLRLADALDARGVIVCQMGAQELRAEALRIPAGLLPVIPARPNADGETLCFVRWIAEKPDGTWLGAYDLAAFDGLLRVSPTSQEADKPR